MIILRFNIQREWIEVIDKWRKIHLENKKQRLLSEDLKENDDIDDLDNVYQVCSSGDDITEQEIEEYICSGCGKIYASQWPKCPGCSRRGTHIKKSMTPAPKS